MLRSLQPTEWSAPHTSKVVAARALRFLALPLTVCLVSGQEHGEEGPQHIAMYKLLCHCAVHHGLFKLSGAAHVRDSASFRDGQCLSLAQVCNPDMSWRIREPTCKGNYEDAGPPKLDHHLRSLDGHHWLHTFSHSATCLSQEIFESSENIFLATRHPMRYQIWLGLASKFGRFYFNKFTPRSASQFHWQPLTPKEPTVRS